MAMKKYINYQALESAEINFCLGTDRQGKPTIQMYIGAEAAEVAFVSPACVTNWPRVTGDGNFGTMWGPTEVTKAKFTLDLTDGPINEGTNEHYSLLTDLMSAVDDRLLDFVQANQLRILGRKNLSRDECKMLQIRTVRPKYDKATGVLSGHSVQLSTSKFAWDGCGGRYPRTINVCDHQGAVVPNGTVQPGDVVAVTMFANQVYTGVGGDKFGIHWSFEDVQVVCQRSRLAQKTSVPSFQANTYEFAMPYTQPTSVVSCGGTDIESQFSEPMAVA
jgi:hypothetical protein